MCISHRERNLGHKTRESRTKSFSSALILEEVESISDNFHAEIETERSKMLKAHTNSEVTLSNRLTSSQKLWD